MAEGVVRRVQLVAEMSDRRATGNHEALRLVGTKEIEGPASNRHILEMADRLDVAYENDDIPWCGLFAGHCVGASLPDEVLPTVVLRARAW